MRGFKETTLRLLMLLLFQLLIPSVIAQDPKIAKAGCQSKCGNVTVPFPFGIGEEHCYLDKDYAIDCHQNNWPFLKRVNVEVLDISLDENKMLIRHPVFNVCQNGEYSINETVNLEGTPFFFSKENKLTGFGCNNFVYMYSSYRESTTFLGGCFSFCDSKLNYNNTENDQDNCSGLRCCQTTIPWRSQHFIITMPDSNISYIGGGEASKQQECRYAFLADPKLFAVHQDQKVLETTHVPVTLVWRVNKTFPLVSALIRDSNYSVPDWHTGYKGGLDYPWDYNPMDSPIPCLAKSGTGHGFGRYDKNTAYCHCGDGYEGNPYLEDGCTDIDECKRDQQPCKPGYVCKNTPGDYACTDPRLKKNRVIVLGLGTSLAALFLLLVAWWSLSIITQRRKQLKRKKEFFRRNGGLLLKQQFTPFHERVDRCRLFRSEDLDKATDQFNTNRVLGQGGQGTVYKGILPDGRTIAVKKLKTIDEGKLDEFVNEVVILSQINHRNVVKLLGCCLETEVPLLVYEFIPNGTLFEYLHHRREEFKFTWDMRLRIGTEVADALSYLHTEASEPIYHRDIKSANILLDDKLKAKVADFGTSKSVAMDQTHVITKVQGTFGYLDPEYFHSSQLTDKSDVFSFGVVLVELLTGQRPTSSTKSGKNRSLISYFNLAMKENKLYDILDDEVRLGKKEEIMAVASLAKRCLETNGTNRPTMKVVAAELERIRAQLEGSIQVQHHFEEVEHVRTEISGIFSSSTSSTFSILGASTNGEPLMIGQ